jgi:hypothetical protein
MAFDMQQLKTAALQALTKVGTDVRQDLWSPQNQAFLKQMAEDLAGLSAKLVAEQDPEKKKRLSRSIDLITNHVAVMAFSRLNVIEQGVKATVLNTLEQAASLAVKALLAGIGIAL